MTATRRLALAWLSRWWIAVLALAYALPTRAADAAGWLDVTPRYAVMSAFAPELEWLQDHVQRPETYIAAGERFTTGELGGQPVVLLLSGISMVNAAMTTQLLLDRFNVTHLVFSGIAGGVNPRLTIGDVSIPARWGEYLETVAMRQLPDGRYVTPTTKGPIRFAPFGMWQPRNVRVRQASVPGIQSKFWFAVNPQMLAVARTLGDVPLQTCDAQGQCLEHPPQLIVGGNGVSGQTFVDNAALRRYIYRTFHANVVDMETAAVAAVAYTNCVPFIAFRSLSDLAGGGPGANQMDTFLHLAAGNLARVVMAFLRASTTYRGSRTRPGEHR